jgi:hypothetical protein
MREAVSMLRRVTIVLAILLALSVVVALVTPRPERADDPTPIRVTGARDVATPVSGTLPRDKVVRAHVGDLVDLTVTSNEPDSASSDELGLTEAVSRGAPAHFSFLALRAGRFDMTLLLSGETVGRIEVSPSGRRNRRPPEK